MDAKFAAALSCITTGEFGRLINNNSERVATQAKYLKGRQILQRIMNHSKTSETDGQLLGLRDLMELNMGGDDIRGFVSRWDATLLTMRTAQAPDVLELRFPGASSVTPPA